MKIRQTQSWMEILLQTLHPSTEINWSRGKRWVFLPGVFKHHPVNKLRFSKKELEEITRDTGLHGKSKRVRWALLHHFGTTLRVWLTRQKGYYPEETIWIGNNCAWQILGCNLWNGTLPSVKFASSAILKQVHQFYMEEHGGCHEHGCGWAVHLDIAAMENTHPLWHAWSCCN